MVAFSVSFLLKCSSLWLYVLPCGCLIKTSSCIITEQSPGARCADSNGWTENLAKQPMHCNEANENSEGGCTENGICSHEVLDDGESCLGSKAAHNKMIRKVFFFPSVGLVNCHVFKRWLEGYN